MEEHIPLPGEEEEEEGIPKPHWEPVAPPSTGGGQADDYQPPRVDKINRQAVMIIGITCGVIIILVAIGVIAAILIPTAFSTKNQAVNEQARNAVRTVISAEAEYYSANARYASMTDLCRDGYLDNSYLGDPADLGNGVTIMLTLAPDAAAFQVVATGESAVYEGNSNGQITER